MQMNKTNMHWVMILLIVFAVATRLVPHPPNFTPIGAIGLFSGAYLTIKRFWLVPIIALLISDYLIGIYPPVAMLSVYFSFIISAIIGRVLLQSNTTSLRIGGAAFASAIQFFVITNLGVWSTGLMYPMTSSGLVESYVMAIPYFGNTLVGDLFYSLLLFGCFSLVTTFIHEKHSGAPERI